jgi:ATP-binding cassette subfamily B protein IrtA
MANFERGIMRLMRITNHPLEVVGVTHRYRRIRFHGPEFVSALEVSPTLWMRLWVPNERTGDVSQRGYTFVAVDQEAGIFDVDFVLHDDAPGPASDWAKRVRPGERIEAAMTPAHLDIPQEVDHCRCRRTRSSR